MHNLLIQLLKIISMATSIKKTVRKQLIKLLR